MHISAAFKKKIISVYRKSRPKDGLVTCVKTNEYFLNHKKIPLDVKLACEDKVRFRKKMAVEKIGILRLDYILKVILSFYL